MFWITPVAFTPAFATCSLMAYAVDVPGETVPPETIYTHLLPVELYVPVDADDDLEFASLEWSP